MPKTGWWTERARRRYGENYRTNPGYQADLAFMRGEISSKTNPKPIHAEDSFAAKVMLNKWFLPAVWFGYLGCTWIAVVLTTLVGCLFFGLIILMAALGSG